MKFFKRIRNIFNLSPSDKKAWNPSLWNLYSGGDHSGENVNEYTALTYSAVFNAITLISGSLGSLPLHLMRQNGKSKERALEQSLYRIMHSKANPYMTAMSLREILMAHVLGWGNGYAEIVRDRSGIIKELWPITPNRVTPRMFEGDMIYEIKVDGSTVVLKRPQILHLAGLGFDGFVGYSIVSMAAKSIGLGMALETFGGLYFKQGTHPGVIVSHPGKLNDESHSNLQKSLANTYSGLGKSHRLMLLEDGMKLEKIGIPPNDSQFLESRQHQVPEIARWFNLPPHKLKDLTKSSFNNIEQEQLSYVIDSLLPWAVRLEQSYDMQLLTENDQKQGLYFKHVFEGMLRGSSADRAEFYRKMFGIGAMTINEIREKEDMNPVDGGDIHLVPLNMTTLENAGKEPEKVTPVEPVQEEDRVVDIKLLPKIQGGQK
jgi:HK97 family phage portal protein